MSSTGTTNDVNEDDLERFLDGLRLSNSSPVDEDIDRAAQMLQRVVNLKHLNQKDYREMAEKMVSLSVNNTANTATRTDATNSPSQTLQNQIHDSFSAMSMGQYYSSDRTNDMNHQQSQQQQQQQPHSPMIPQLRQPKPAGSSFLSSFGSPSSQQQHPRRGRSPARSTIYNSVSGDTIPTNANHTNKKTRGSGPTTHSPSGIRSRSPIRHLFGGGGGGNSNGNTSGTNKIPPTAATTNSGSKPRASSPFSMFWRNKSTTTNPNPNGTDEKKGGQEEKKDHENKDDSTTGSTAPGNTKHKLLRPGMRDQSPGASPNRLGGGLHQPQSSLEHHIPQHPPIPSIPNNNNNSNSYQPPKQIFHPSSPVRQFPPVSTSSRPSTPVSFNMHNNSTYNNNNRPPSRCSSPYSARPGLQEDGDSDSLSVLGRSPGRAFETIATSSSTAIPPPQHQTISNMQSSGMSSQHQHRRMHSGGGSIDIDKISKPVPPRTHSRSPMRRPSPTDDDDVGNRQPVIPRAFSASPRGRTVATMQYTTSANGSSEHIKMPDLSMPNFSSPNGTTGFGEKVPTMFTPTPRIVPPSWPNYNHDDDGININTEGVEVMASFPDRTNQNHPSFGLHPKPRGPETLNGTTNDLQFQIGSGGSNHRLPYRGSNRRASSTTADHQPPTIPRTPTIPREQVGSPMDIDEPSPVRPPTGIGTSQATPVTSPQPNARFNVGVSNLKSNRISRIQQPTRSSSMIETNTAALGDIPLPKGNADSSFSSTQHSTTPIQYDSSIHPGQDNSGRVAFIASKREEAKVCHMSGDYRSSITAYTEAIKVYGEAAAFLTSDTLAVLLSNRAAGLLMIGAYEAAVSDCELALRKVTPPRVNEQFSNDSGLLLKIKLLTRLARAHLKLGDHNAASTSFNDAIRTANTASQFSKKNHSEETYRQNQQTLNQMITEATLGNADAKRLRDACEHISNRSLSSLKFPSERIKYAESLGHVNLALSIASGSMKLIENKITILVFMKRWREVAGFCERLAAFNVGMDNAFRDDLALKFPFPGVAPAQALKADFFGNLRDEDASTRELKLNSRAAAEAVLRIPHNLTQMYLRAMRLEERYPAADAALRSLDDLIRRGAGIHGPTQHLQKKFAWLPIERKKLDRTKEGRELGDELFRLQDFEKAATKYGECLLIDGEGSSDPVDGLNVGGRLHAVLHCNRAACLMALRRFHAAVDECSNALKIHSRYMKAILRRARCYTRLSRTEEAISEYKRWLDLVEEAKKTDYSPSSPCLFDGPRDVKDAEVSLTQKELEELYKAKRRADATAKEEADRMRDRERARFQDSFSNSWRSNTSANAHDRRDQWYNDQSGSRRWDSFSNRGPRSSSNPRPDSNGADKDNQRSNSQGRTRPESLVSPRSNTADHYSVLNIASNATVDEIKKSFRKLALKYHPDKNTDDGASDNFRRVKLAHEVLGDPIKRRQYDSERQLNVGRHF